MTCHCKVQCTSTRAQLININHDMISHTKLHNLFCATCRHVLILQYLRIEVRSRESFHIAPQSVASPMATTGTAGNAEQKHQTCAPFVHLHATDCTFDMTSIRCGLCALQHSAARKLSQRGARRRRRPRRRRRWVSSAGGRSWRRRPEPPGPHLCHIIVCVYMTI